MLPLYSKVFLSEKARAVRPLALPGYLYCTRQMILQPLGTYYMCIKLVKCPVVWYFTMDILNYWVKMNAFFPKMTCSVNKMWINHSLLTKYFVPLYSLNLNLLHCSLSIVSDFKMHVRVTEQSIKDLRLIIKLGRQSCFELGAVFPIAVPCCVPNRIPHFWIPGFFRLDLWLLVLWFLAPCELN